MRSHRIQAGPVSRIFEIRPSRILCGKTTESTSVKQKRFGVISQKKCVNSHRGVNVKIILVPFSVGRGQNFDYNATSISNFIGRADLDASLHRKFIASDNVSRTDPDIPYVDLIYRVASKKRSIQCQFQTYHGM